MKIRIGYQIFANFHIYPLYKLQQPDIPTLVISYYHRIMTLVTYSITSYQQMCKDATNRSKIMLDFKTIIDRRIRIQMQYLMKMRQLTLMPQMKRIPNPTRATQIIYNSLINAIQVQIDGITNHVGRMQTQISKQLAGLCSQLDNQSKREIINAGIIVKQYDRKNQDIQKLRVKVSKKTHQLKKLKQQYIVGTLVDMPFDKKNRLFIRIKQIQQGYKPLRDQYQQNVKVFNEKAAVSANKLNQIVKRIEHCESQKIELMKKIFMVLQISNSEYGANLIQDKATILSRLNNLQQTNPDFKKCQTEAFEACKKQMMVQQHDPCSYVNNLFTNIVDTKNMQGLVIYGHQAKHRGSINECMIESVQTQIVEQKPEFMFVKQIASGFKNIFNKDVEFDPLKMKRLEQLMQNSPQGRKNFILCLQKFRTIGKFQISDQKVQHIEYILNLFLDQCMRQLDTYNSKLLLVLSFTYYVINKEGEKIDLHKFVQAHKIWTDKQWWECALLETSYEQLKIKPKKMEEPPITIWHIKGSGFKHNEGEHEMTSQNILFNQLTFYLHNMRLFEIKEQIITYIARKYVKYFQLSPKVAADIEPFLKVQEVSLEELESENGGSPITPKKRGFGLTKKLFSRN